MIIARNLFISTSILGLWLLLGYLVAWFSEGLAYETEYAKLKAENVELALTVSNELNRIRVQLPLLENRAQIKNALISSDYKERNELNEFLKIQSFSAQADLIFVADKQGKVIASSNYDSHLEFIGNDVSLQPYYQQAILLEKAEYYSVDYNLQNKGYYFSSPVILHNEVQGVVTMRYRLDEIFALLYQNDNINFLVGVDGVVFDSSRDDLNFSTVVPSSDPRRQWLRDSERYGKSDLPAMSEHTISEFFGDTKLTIGTGDNQTNVLVHSYPVQNASWIVFSALPRDVLFPSVVAALLFYLTLSGLFLLLWLYLRKRNEMQVHMADMNEQLEHRVEDLTSGLKHSNKELKTLVEHYQTSQEKLEQTQYELLQTARLAALGELSATLNHELSQPALALRAYTENSRKLLQRGDYATVENNFNEMHSIYDSMSNIVSTIKTFARQTTPEMRHVSVGDIIESTMPIVTHLITKNGVVIHLPDEGNHLKIRCVPEQIEQVLVNLISNAVDALLGKQDAQVWIGIKDKQRTVDICVRNNHSAVKRKELKHLFDPFYTTKEDGLGIGLALCKRIVEAQDGKITARICRNHDIEFVVTLNKLRSE